MSLADWLRNGWLVEHQTTNSEVSELLALVDRDLADCRVKGLSADWKLNIAYNAALQAATIALVASGYRASRDSHHFRVIHSLSFTLGADTTFIRKFDLFRKKRNMGGYERAGFISETEADEMIELAEQLHREVVRFLEKSYPMLLDSSVHDC